MYKKGEEGVYYIHRQILCLIYDNTNDYYKSFDDLYDIDVLRVFKNVVKGFINEKNFSEQVKNKVLNMLNDGRYIKDKDTEKRVEIINDIISMLNLSIDESIKFYRCELYFRTRNKKYLRWYSDKKITSQIDFVHDSIVNDFSVLYSHSSNATEKEFEDDFLEDFIDNDLYIGSLNMILEECPSIFEDKLFRKRAKKVMDLSKVRDKNYRDLNKVLTKRI